jgi:hypothetical protein
MKNVLIVSSLLLAVSCAPKKSKKVKIPEPPRSPYQAEHTINIDFSDVGEDARKLNEFVDSILKDMVAVKIGEYYWKVEPKEWKTFTLGTDPLTERAAIRLYKVALDSVQKKLAEQSNPAVKIELQMFADLLKNKIAHEQIKLNSNHIDLYGSLVIPLWGDQLLARAQGRNFSDQVLLKYFQEANAQKVYSKFGNHLKKITQKNKIYVDVESVSGIQRFLDDIEGISSNLCDTVTMKVDLPTWDEMEDENFSWDTWDSENPTYTECKKFEKQYRGILETVRELKDSGKLAIKRTYSKKEYAALLKQHGVYTDPDTMYSMAKAELKRVKIKYNNLINRLRQHNNLGDDENIMAYYRQNNLPQDDYVLKSYVEEANSEIDQIIRDNDLLTLPVEEQIVHYAGLVTGEFAETIKQRAAHGIPQMIQMLEGFETQPFALWPAVAVMKEKTPDWLVSPSLHATSAHEGRPGHEMQFFKIQKSKFKSKVRHHLIDNTANTEGWALYAESIVETHVEDMAQQLYYLQAYLLRIVRVITDYETQLGISTYDEGVQFHIDTLGFSEKTAISEMDRREKWPGRDTGYFMGRKSIEALKMRTKLKYQDSFTEKCFNDVVVEYSFSPAQYIEQYIDATDNCLTSLQ